MGAMWAGAAVYLLGTVWFVSLWVQGRKPSWPCLAAAAVFGAAAGFFREMPPSGQFLWILILGAIGWCGACLVLRREGFVRLLCVSMALLATWLPLSLCADVVWEYCLIAALLLLCGALSLGDRLASNERKLSSVWYAELLPLSAPAAAVLLMAGEKTVSFPQAAAWGAVVLAVCVISLCLQEQLLQRRRLELLNRAFRQWQQESRDYMNTIRSQRHDFNLHLHAISGLISGGEYAQCGEYVRKLVEDAAAVNDIMPVADAVVGSMLYNMREQARRKGSDIAYRITYDMEDIVCNGFECNKIIGNLLQNAIDAMKTPEDLAFGIRASIFKRRGNTVICVENRFTGDPATIAAAFEPGWSTKRGHEGIGLAMVLRTAEQYGGRVYPEFEEDTVRFIAAIPNRVRFDRKEEPQ